MSLPTKKRVLQKYRKEYSEKFPVLTVSKRGEQFTYCKVCSIDVNIGHGGISDIQRHINSKKHSSNAAAAQGKPLTSFFTTTSDVSVINAEVLMTEFIIEHSLPLTVADHCAKLFKNMFPDSQIAQKYACGRTKTSYIVDTLGKDSQKRILNTIRESPFSMATDGSTDYEDVKLYPVCVRYFDPKEGQVMSVLLSLTECAKPSTGENIFKILQSEMDKFEIPWKNLVCFSADNALVMLGKVKGVSAFLLKEAPSLYVAGCPCHLMHIAAERASKHLPVKVDDLLIDIFYHLEKSSKRKQSFKAHQEKTGTPPHKILKHVSTRWLSLGQCIARLLEQWDALLSFFREEVANEKPTNKKHAEQGSSSKPASLASVSGTSAVKQKSAAVQQKPAVQPGTKRPMAEDINSAKDKRPKTSAFLSGYKIPVTSSGQPGSKEVATTLQCQDGSSSQKATNKKPPSLASVSDTPAVKQKSTVLPGSKRPVTSSVKPSKKVSGNSQCQDASSSKAVSGRSSICVGRNPFFPSQPGSLTHGTSAKPSKRSPSSSNQTSKSTSKERTSATKSPATNTDTKPQRVISRMTDPNVKLCCLFLNKTLPLFEESNVILQKDEPCIHRLHTTMCSQLRDLLVRFVKPQVITSQTVVYEVDFTNEDNQKSDDEIYVGLAVRTFIQSNGEECDLKNFYKCVRSYYVAACSYMVKAYPFKEAVLENAEVLDVSKRNQVKLKQWLYFAERYHQLIGDEERENIEEEFCRFQVDTFEDILKPEMRVDQVWNEISHLKLPASGGARYPALVKIAKIVLVMYHSNADCERIFSLVNKNKTEFRSSLSTKVLGNLMTRRMSMVATATPCYAMSHSAALLKQAKQATAAGLKS